MSRPAIQRTNSELRDYLEGTVEADPNSGCWLWANLGCDSRGYGRLHINGKREKAHRVSYAAYVGPIPEGECVLHSCDTPACINPNHLRTGSQKDNAADRESRNRGNHPIEDRHPKAKLTSEDAVRIRGLAKAGVGQRVLGRRFGVTHATIRAVLTRQTWRGAA